MPYSLCYRRLTFDQAKEELEQRILGHRVPGLAPARVLAASDSFEATFGRRLFARLELNP